MGYYPDDVNPKDPNAPWNQKDEPSFIAHRIDVCVECHFEEPVKVNEEGICEDCFEKQCERADYE